jgi:hypothetical protein
MVMACVEVTDTTGAIAVGNFKGASAPFFHQTSPPGVNAAPSPLIVRMMPALIPKTPQARLCPKDIGHPRKDES